MIHPSDKMKQGDKIEFLYAHQSEMVKANKENRPPRLVMRSGTVDELLPTAVRLTNGRGYRSYGYRGMKNLTVH